MDVNAFFSEHDEAVAVRWWRGTNGRPRQDHEAMMEVQPGSLWPKSYIFFTVQNAVHLVNILNNIFIS